MPASVAERLLDGAKNRVTTGDISLVERPRPLLADIEVDVQPGVALPLDGAGDVLPGDDGLVTGAVVVEHVEDLAQLAARLGSHGPNGVGSVGDLLGVEVAADAQGGSVEGDERQALGQRVVHLTREVGPLLGTRLRDAGLSQLLLVREQDAEQHPGDVVHDRRQ